MNKKTVIFDLDGTLANIDVRRDKSLKPNGKLDWEIFAAPDSILNFRTSKYWDVIEALHAGPVLITDGKINITTEEEVFFNTPIAGVQPRSAIGYTKYGELIIMVVDGRQADSRGVYLEELALLMSQFHCLEAMNLDGGGSSAMVADSRLLNRPAGRTIQREVMSSIGIFYNN